MEWESSQGSYLAPELYVEQETVGTPFEPLPGVQIRSGEHRYGYAWLYMGTSSSRALSGEVWLRAGGYYDGSLNEQTFKLVWRPSPLWSVNPVLNRQDLKAGNSSFTARTVSLKLEHTPSTRSAQSLTIQHDNVSRQTLLGLRARWEIARGQDVRLAIDRASSPNDATATSRPLNDYRVTASISWAFGR